MNNEARGACADQLRGRHAATYTGATQVVGPPPSVFPFADAQPRDLTRAGECDVRGTRENGRRVAFYAAVPGGLLVDPLR